MELNLDLKDRKILYQLDVNARQTNSTIAKKVALSKDAVGYRIKNLEKQGIIRGYRAVVDTSKLGYLFYRVLLNLMDMQTDKLIKLIKFLENQKNVWWIAKLDGSWNFVFAIWVKSNKEFLEFYDNLCLEFRENIKERLICPVVSYKNISKRYLLDTKQELKITSIGGGEKEKVDETDFEILKLLAENARTPLIDIAHELKLDSMTIYHRIKKLEDRKIIQGYKVDLDSGKLNRDFYSLKINLRNITRLKEIEDSIFSIPQVIAKTEAIGSYDLEFDLEVKNSEEYFKILESLENKFDFIREITYFRVLKSYKILYMPE